uniref:Tetratricopeptide repeat n=1 Tax=Theileria annulata TaxID=5874 RepID=A0A3B0MHJ2_THEAN
MDSDFRDVDVVSELDKLSSENNYNEIVNLLRENFYQFNDDPNKLIAILTIRIYYNLHLKNFNEVDSDFGLIESIFTDKLNSQFSYTKDSVCPFSTFLIHAYYPHMKGSSFQSLTRMFDLFHKLNDDLKSQGSKYDKGDESESCKKREVTVKRIMKTGLLLSDVLFTLLRPHEAIKLLKEVNLKYDEGDVSTNMILSVIYRKLGYKEESERYMKVILGKEGVEPPYRGLLKMFKKDYEGASEEFKSVLSLGKKSLSPQESVLLNNLAVSTLYAGSSQEAKNLFFNFEILTHGFQAHRGIMSNADVLVELSIYE